MGLRTQILVTIFSSIIWQKCVSGQEARLPFLAADVGSFPKCKVYGRTYCLDAPDYPKQTIQYLLENHLFDVRSVILSEGIPASEFGGQDKTNSLDFNKNGKPETVFAERNLTSLPDSISIKVSHTLKHDVKDDNRPKRRDRTNGSIQPESRSRYGLADSDDPENKIILAGNKKSQNQDYVPNFQRKASAEFFRAGQSDSDPLSLGELKPIQISEAHPREFDLETQEAVRPRSVETSKKTIFDELKNLEGSVFGEEDSIFNELLAATAKSNLPKDPVPTEGQTLLQIQGQTLQNIQGQTLQQIQGQNLQQIEGLTLQQQTEGLTLQQIQGLTLQQQAEGLTVQQIEDEYGNGSEDEDEGDDLDYVNNNGKFEPEVSSVVYEAPNPSKGFNFFNFKPLKEGASSNLIEEVENQAQQLEKTSFKRENQINLVNPNQSYLVNPNQVNLGSPNQVNLGNPNQVNLGPQGQVSFPSFFNSEAIDEELKNYQDQIHHGEKNEKKEVKHYLGFQKHVLPVNSIDFDQKLVSESLVATQQYEKAYKEQQAAFQQNQENSVEFEIPVEGKKSNVASPQILPVLETRQQPIASQLDIYAEKPGNFPGPEPETNVGDLKAFHDELDRLINGENPHGEFKSFFRNPSSLSFENVEDDEQVDLANLDHTLTIVTLSPKLLPQDINQAQAGTAAPGAEKLFRELTEVDLEEDTESPALIGRYSNEADPKEKKVAERAIYGQNVDLNQNNNDQSEKFNELPVFKVQRAQPLEPRPTHVSYKEGSIHFSNGQESEDSTEVVTKGQFGQDGQELDTQVDVVILETGNADLEDETDPRKIFDFLYRNVQEVQPPTDLDQNNPNSNQNNPSINKNNPNTNPIYNINPNYNDANSNQFDLSQHASLNQQADPNTDIQNEIKEHVYQPGEVYYKPIEQAKEESVEEVEPTKDLPVKYKELVDPVDNPIFRSQTEQRNSNKNPFLPEQAASTDQKVYYKPIEDKPSTETYYKPVTGADPNHKAAKKSPENSFSQKIVLDDSDSGNIFQSEYEFKPVLSPPPEFFELRPVTKNLFQKPGDKLATSVSPRTTSSAPETTSPVPEYAEEDYNNYTEASDNVYEVEEPTAPEEQPLEESETQQNYYQDYHPLPVEARHKRKSAKPVNTGIYSAFQRVTNVFDNLFVNRLRFGRSRRFKRETEIRTRGLPIPSPTAARISPTRGTRVATLAEPEPEDVCPTRKHFIHPTVAFSVKGQWMYIVNLPGNESHQQGIVTEECMTSKCNKVCTNDPTTEASCQPRFVQKRLVALHPNGEKLTSELFWFPATCSCKINKI